MAGNRRLGEPVSDAEFEAMPERISEHFDRVRARLAEELADDSQ